MLLVRRGLIAALSRGAPGSALCGLGAAPPLKQRAEERAGNRLLVQTARNYAPRAKKKQEFVSQLADLPPTMLKKDYANVQLMETVDDVVRRLLSLEMANQKEKVKIKTQQMVDKVKRNPNDSGSPESQIAVLTVKIRNFQEHIQMHPKDKSNKRIMLMAIDRRNKLLKYLRLTRYDAFENVCKQLGIEYVIPSQYHRRPTRRWIAKKALCIKVFNEVQKLKIAKRREERVAAEARAGTIPTEKPLANSEAVQ
ncbi:small ribosomal subunit protein uS15m [Microcaecilia unicolor]|uniref:Small ribosomal subunit protein uS15m n=1 Tax=Microcaecilia unicolor TaxID=1415580 RepID=A0A6P7ZFI4_9AMPH|nr:28S ribosomal protein S15, mitochondrial [Microcaecilia unicolor]